MKRLLLLLVFSVLVFWLSGCQKNDPGQIAKDDGQFPKSLAGTWKADKGKWQVTLAPDGNVVSFVTNGGFLLVMAEGELFRKGPNEESFLYFVFGPYDTNYDPQTRELSVSVTIENSHIQFSNHQIMEGVIEYHITGPVSEDFKKWDVKLISYSGPLDKEPPEPNFSEASSYVFHKVEENPQNLPEDQ